MNRMTFAFLELRRTLRGVPAYELSAADYFNHVMVEQLHRIHGGRETMMIYGGDNAGFDPSGGE